MAEHHDTAVEYGTATGNDYAEHDRTYRFFTALTKYGTIAVVILLIFLAVVFI